MPVFIVSHAAAFEGIKIEGDFITGFPKGTLNDPPAGQAKPEMAAQIEKSNKP